MRVPVAVFKDEVPFPFCNVVARIYERGQRTQEVSLSTDDKGVAEMNVDADEHADVGLVVDGKEIFGKRPLRDGIVVRM